MKEQLIKEETFKIAKSKKFSNIKTVSLYGASEIVESQQEVVPTQSLLQAWLRNEHKIEIAVQWFDKGYIKAVKKQPFKNNTYRMETWNSYEEALEMALFEGLNLISDEGNNK